jgi:hypothetical protein
MRFHTAILSAVVVLGCAASTSAQSVALQFNNGLVTLNAQNAPVRTILDEWARLGGTQFVNADRVGGAPVSLELTAVPERQALEILLRSVAGYVATQRVQGTGLSRLGGVVILPTSNAVRAPAPVTFGPATVQRPAQDDSREDLNPDGPGGFRLPTTLNPANVPPATNVPPIRVLTPPANAPFGSVTDPAAGTTTVIRPPTTLPGVPGATSRPGEITPVPQPQSGQPTR